ncbi:hypothetical protein [Aquimarina algiphila]|uniref:hypothetical protein n=1 Tax=Aquimarina algiphila TaxID=2047982 RepID=UPI00248FA475|nr:hypothetical protein [Aquimarina algiphila]
MTEEQGKQIIELLEDISSKLDDIKYNTSDLTNLTSDVYVLDDIKKILKDNI